MTPRPKGRPAAADGPTQDLLTILGQKPRPAPPRRRAPRARIVMQLGALQLTLGHQRAPLGSLAV